MNTRKLKQQKNEIRSSKHKERSKAKNPILFFRFGRVSRLVSMMGISGPHTILAFIDRDGTFNTKQASSGPTFQSWAPHQSFLLLISFVGSTFNECLIILPLNLFSSCNLSRWFIETHQYHTIEANFFFFKFIIDITLTIIKVYFLRFKLLVFLDGDPRIKKSYYQRIFVYFTPI